MALIVANYSLNQTNRTLVAAVANKVIRVTRVVFSTENSGTLKLQSDPGGAADAVIVPLQYLGGKGVTDIALGREYAVMTERGKALGYTAALTGVTQPHSIMVWYEVVD